jgi:polyisoprenoid-binding protein YceI
MRRTLVSIALCSLLVAGAHASLAPAQTTERRAIDPAKSSATFGVQHIFVERVTGSVPIASGEVELSSGSLIPLSFSAVLDPARMNSGDPDRDASLESPDYFDTKKFPTWTFASTKIVPAGPAAFRAEGTLTMHGVAQAETLDVSVRGDAAHPLYRAVGHVDRRAFALKGTRLDPVIGNVADITLDVVLKPATGGVSTK